MSNKRSRFETQNLHLRSSTQKGTNIRYKNPAHCPMKPTRCSMISFFFLLLPSKPFHTHSHCVQRAPHVPSLLLAVAQEGPELAGVDVTVDGNQEALVELEGTGELLGQLPHALQELVDDRRHLLGISVQVSVPAARPVMEHETGAS